MHRCKANIYTIIKPLVFHPIKVGVRMNMTEKKFYEKPMLEYCGPMSERTLGMNGYTMDGGYTYTQTGGGNDDIPGPH